MVDLVTSSVAYVSAWFEATPPRRTPPPTGFFATPPPILV